MWLFLLPCRCNPCYMWLYLLLSFQLHHLVVLVSMQAVIAVMLLDGYSLPQCGYLQLFVLIAWSCLLPYGCSCCCAAIFLQYTPVWLNCPMSVPASYHERGHFIALGLQPLLSLLLYLRLMPIIFQLGWPIIHISPAWLVQDCRCSYS